MEEHLISLFSILSPSLLKITLGLLRNIEELFRSKTSAIPDFSFVSPYWVIIGNLLLSLGLSWENRADFPQELLQERISAWRNEPKKKQESYNGLTALEKT